MSDRSANVGQERKCGTGAQIVGLPPPHREGSPDSEGKKDVKVLPCDWGGRPRDLPPGPVSPARRRDAHGVREVETRWGGTPRLRGGRTGAGEVPDFHPEGGSMAPSLSLSLRPSSVSLAEDLDRNEPTTRAVEGVRNLDRSVT